MEGGNRNGIFNSRIVVPVQGNHPYSAMVRQDWPAQAQAGCGKWLPLLRCKAGRSIVGHSLLSCSRGGAGPLNSPSFNRLAALHRHLAALQAEKTRLEMLIRSVEEIIGCEKRNESMNDEAKFNGRQSTTTKPPTIRKYGNDMATRQ